MAGIGPLRAPYALFIIILMVLGVIAGAFYFYNAASQNPCGNPGPAKFAALPDQTLTVGGQPRTYRAVAANFTGTQQEEVISSVTFYTTAFNDPSIPHIINGVCASDTGTPASITVKITSSSTGLVESIGPFLFKGSAPDGQQMLTSDEQAGLLWNSGISASLILLVAA